MCIRLYKTDRESRLIKFSFFVRVFRLAENAMTATERTSLLDHVDEGGPKMNLLYTCREIFPRSLGTASSD